MDVLLVVLSKNIEDAKKFYLNTPSMENTKYFFVFSETPHERDITWLKSPNQYIALYGNGVDNPAFIAVRAGLLYTKSSHIIYLSTSNPPTEKMVSQVIDELLNLDIEDRIEIIQHKNITAASREFFLLYGFSEFEKYIFEPMSDIEVKYYMGQAMLGKPVDYEIAYKTIADIVDLKNVNCFPYGHSDEFAELTKYISDYIKVDDKLKANVIFYEAHPVVYEQAIRRLKEYLGFISNDGAVVAYVSNNIDKMLEIAKPIAKINVNDIGWVLIYTKDTKING